MITVVLRIQTKEYKSWFSFGKQLSPEGRSWLDQNDRTIIALLLVSFLRIQTIAIMVFLRKTIISRREIMVGSE